MNWDKINLKACLEVLRSLEMNTPTISQPLKIVYSDGFEELTISYKVIKELSSKQEEEK